MKLQTRAMALCLAATLFCLPLLAAPQSGALRLGDMLPSIQGQSLRGKAVELPADADRSPAVCLFAFSRAGGHDAQNWAEHLSKDLPHLAVYNVIFLESVPRLFRSVVISAIKGGMPEPMQGRAMVVDRDESLWKRRLQLKDPAVAILVLLDSTGHVQQITSGPFSDSQYLVVRNSVRAVNLDREN